MLKTMFLKEGLKGILVIWFLLCILPGDCLVLGCAEKDSFYCVQKEYDAVSSHHDDCSSIPTDDPCCPNCCALCANNLVLHVFQDSSFVFTSPSSRIKTPLFSHFDTIFQTNIYHPPRLTA